MSRTHTVAQGECLTMIADKYGVTVSAIRDHPQNAELRQKRPSPHVLHPGDVISIPGPEPRTESAQTGQSHRFRYRRPEKRLKLALSGPDRERLRDKPFSLKVAGRVTNGRTDGQGQIDYAPHPTALKIATGRKTGSGSRMR